MICSVFVVCDDELASTHLRAYHHIFTFRNKNLPVFNRSLVNIFNIHHTNHASRSAVVRHDIHLSIDDVDWRIVVIHVECDLHKLAFRVFHVTNPKCGACSLSTFEEEHITFILVGSHTVEIARLTWVFIEKLVFFLWVAELMIVNLMVFVDIRKLLACHRFVVSGIEKSVFIPICASKLGPFDMIWKQFLRRHVFHINLDPV